MEVRGINHLALVTGDMEATVQFYRDALGMEVVATTGNRPGSYPFRHYFFKLGAHTTLAFFELPEMAEPFPKPPQSSTLILARGRAERKPRDTCRSIHPHLRRKAGPVGLAGPGAGKKTSRANGWSPQNRPICKTSAPAPPRPAQKRKNKPNSPLNAQKHKK